jgi:hypothetical protein
VPTIGDGTAAMGLPTLKSSVIVSPTLPPAPSQCVLDANPAEDPAGILKAAKALSQKRDKEQRQHHKQNYDVCQCEPYAALCLPGKVVSISFKGEHSDKGPPRAGERSARQPRRRAARRLILGIIGPASRQAAADDIRWREFCEWTERSVTPGRRPSATCGRDEMQPVAFA